MDPLGIDPTVDYVFRKLFGDPRNSDVLIHLLNAVLNTSSPIVAVEILNPFVEKEYEGDKQAILDVKARDASGCWFNIEMQTTVPAGLRRRLVYYGSCLFADQLDEGESYTALRPAICICFLSGIMFFDSPSAHHHFVLFDRVAAVELTDHFQIHTVELPKYNFGEESVSTIPELSRWAYFLNHAAEMTLDQLHRVFREAAFQKAIGVLEMISRTPEERHRHDSRQRALRDYKSTIEEARIQGIEQGIERGIEKGIEQGIEKGIERGIEIGEWIGKVQLLQQLLGEPESSETELIRLSAEELSDRVRVLRTRLVERSV